MMENTGGSEQGQAQNPPLTIWHELDTWARDFKTWQRFVLANAVRLGPLTDEQIGQAYSLFLHDNNLGNLPDSVIEVPAGVPADRLRPLRRRSG